MEYENNQNYPKNSQFSSDTPQNNSSSSTGPNLNQQPVTKVQQKKSSGIWKLIMGILLFLSIAANILLLVVLMGFIAFFAAGRTGPVFLEDVIRQGNSSQKIAMIRIQGVIDQQQSENFRNQIKQAASDYKVKALIIRTMTPGGGVAASDQIHHYINDFRKNTQLPVVAFMQTIAASGGYYTSVAADKIVAEPTAITGSIGVIANIMVLQGLLQEKLGINPVTVKSGEKKNWPNIFGEVTQQQQQYLMEKLINPSYNRFVELVAQGRPDMSIEQIKPLADGSIFSAKEAKEKGLVDTVGYIEDAIASAEELANIKNAHVVEYRKPFGLADLMTSARKNLLNIDKNSIYEISGPKLMYLWDGGK